MKNTNNYKKIDESPNQVSDDEPWLDDSQKNTETETVDWDDAPALTYLYFEYIPAFYVSQYVW